MTQGDSWQKRRNSLIESFKRDYPDTDMAHRCSGRSTAKALELIGWCLQNPERGRKIIDHYGTVESNKRLMELTFDLVKQLRLEGFIWSKARIQIAFSLEPEETRKIRWD